MAEEIIELMGPGITADRKLNNWKAHIFFFCISTHSTGLQKTEAEMDGKHSYTIHRVVAKCTDFILLFT